ncbi:MAG: hypothetical protein IPG82_00285 [Saprospiraceae bacterium]|nr:hypothetical protein [Saprospiraceae bacterium]
MILERKQEAASKAPLAGGKRGRWQAVLSEHPVHLHLLPCAVGLCRLSKKKYFLLLKMNFYSNQLFHVYNQGNNRQIIFHSDHHYEYFLWKMKAYIFPFADLVAYCLMPTHFHWLIYVRQTLVDRKSFRAHVDYIETMRRKELYGANAKPVENTSTRKAHANAHININESIGVLQMAYTRAINQEKGWTGSLFRKECKAKDGWIDEFVTLRKTNGLIDSRFSSGSDYAFTCFNYIHNNPQKAGLVKEAIEWKYSSAKDYSELGRESICNLDLGRELIDHI